MQTIIRIVTRRFMHAWDRLQGYHICAIQQCVKR